MVKDARLAAVNIHRFFLLGDLLKTRELEATTRGKGRASCL